MRNYVLFTLIAVLAFILVGCGGSDEMTSTSEVSSPPTWMTNEPNIKNYMFGAGMGESPSYQLALDMAETRARADIGESIELEMRSMTEDFQEQVGGEMMQQFTQTTRTVVERTLVGTTTRSTEVRQTPNGYRAYVLMEYPVGPAAAEFLQKIRSNDELYTRFRKSKAFDRMNDAVEEYKSRSDSTTSQR